jgi:hypothetical protein
MDEFEEILQMRSPEFESDRAYVEFIRAKNGGAPVEGYFRVRGVDVLAIDAYSTSPTPTSHPRQTCCFTYMRTGGT